MEALILSAVKDILMILITIGVGFLVAYLKKKLGVEKLRKIQKESEFIKEVVTIGVKYAEQKYSSGEKLDAATEWITTRLNEKGIKISKEEVEGLIESTIRDIKDEFGENWANATNEEKK